DAKMRVQMRTELRRLHRRLSVTSILVTHDQVEAMTMGDRLVVMNGGRIEQVGTPAEVYARPASVFVAGFLGSPSMNLFAARTADRGAVALNGTQTADIPFDAALPAGATLTLGIRPEDVSLAPQGQHAHAGIVDLVENLGGHRVVHVRMGDVMVTAIVNQLAALREGQPVSLAFPADRLHAFSAKTGARLSI
ncbi:MAG: TOBE domain-containing protein, partial [Rhodobacteraceae bacterium]|nr:TOBE domain-containing protein [Paracoccaceae bacterium]